jgi:hypothetical protein
MKYDEAINRIKAMKQYKTLLIVGLMIGSIGTGWADIDNQKQCPPGTKFLLTNSWEYSGKCVLKWTPLSRQ